MVNDKDALISTLGAAERPVAFLVGSPLSADQDGTGVPTVPQMIPLLRDEVLSRVQSGLPQFEQRIERLSSADAYQAGVEWLQSHVSQDAVNRVVRKAVLQARRTPLAVEDVPKLESDGKAEDWHIPAGTRSLAELLTIKRFGGPALTTNFDPLLSVAIRQAGKIPMRCVLDADGRLPLEVEFEEEVRTVVHLHGYWRGSNTLHTPVQLTSKRPKLKAALQSLLRHRWLVVVAYGGWDDAFTTALGELQHDDQADLDVLWCFRESDEAVVEARNKRLLEKVRDGITRGRFRMYGGIDCHTVFGDIVAAVRATTAPPLRAVVPLTNWERVDATDLAALAPLREEEVLRYFDGAVPSWRHAVSETIPRRTVVARLVSDVNNLRVTGSCSLHLILGAGGEGKSTVLRQAAADVARTDGWAILWRPNPDVHLDPGEVSDLDPAMQWLLVADDADNLVESAFAAANRLHELGGSNVHLLFASREPDWRAAGGFARPWASRLNHASDTVLRGLTRDDAAAVVKAWGRCGEAGLGELASLSDEAERVAKFLASLAQTSRRDGSFLGGLLAARFGAAGLRAHVREFLKRLREIPIEISPYSLFDALLYVAACDGVDIPGIAQDVLADLLDVRRDRVHSRVVRLLGEEAAGVYSAGQVFTRHSKVAKAILVEADAAFDVDLAEIWTRLVRQTVRSCLDCRNRAHLNYIVHAGPRLLRVLPREIPDERRQEIAISAAMTSVDAMPDCGAVIVSLGKTYRIVGRINDAVEVFHGAMARTVRMADRDSMIRRFYYEWGICERGLQGREHSISAAWLFGVSLSDHLNPAPIDDEQARHGFRGLGGALHNLFRKPAKRNPNHQIPRGLRALAYLGRLVTFNLSELTMFESFDLVADNIGTPPPKDVAEALDWVEEAVQLVGTQVRDEFLRALDESVAITIGALRAHLGGTSDSIR